VTGLTIAQEEAGPILEQSLSDRRITSATYGKRTKSSKWTAEETERFYDAIRQNGSDLAMIALYFPGRSRSQIRAKWKREDKAFPDKVTDALMNRKARGACVLAERAAFDGREQTCRSCPSSSTWICPILARKTPWSSTT
jgi:hypothetical protein